MEQRLREARAAGRTLELRRTWVPLGEISPRLVRAVLVAEDHRFREHHGIDWLALAEEVRWTGDDSFSWLDASDLGALARAVAYAWEHRAELRGRSTITQQLAKNLYFGTERSFVRKAIELVVAKRLERRLGKDRILELYLNVAEWGPGIFGAEEAALAYFGRPASELTLEEAAALAATLPHPLTSNPAQNPGRMRWRQALILERLNAPAAVPPAPLPLPEPDVEIRELELAPLDSLLP
jgi:monofunctional biosynthetic peptidoglycan transglycosylase